MLEDFTLPAARDAVAVFRQPYISPNRGMAAEKSLPTKTRVIIIVLIGPRIPSQLSRVRINAQTRHLCQNQMAGTTYRNLSGVGQFQAAGSWQQVDSSSISCSDPPLRE